MEQNLKIYISIMFYLVKESRKDGLHFLADEIQSSIKNIVIRNFKQQVNSNDVLFDEELETIMEFFASLDSSNIKQFVNFFESLDKNTLN
jgi:hypothetical protein